MSIQAIRVTSSTQTFEVAYNDSSYVSSPNETVPVGLNDNPDDELGRPEQEAENRPL